MPAEPLIIDFGRHFLTDYKEKEFHDSFIRAFRDGRADFITLDSNMRGQKFRAASTAWAIEKGFLYHDQSAGDEQSEVYSFRLTSKGKEEFQVA